MSGIFRYAEKLSAPASLLFAIAAALGADLVLAGTKRAAARFGIAALAVAGLSAAVAFVAERSAHQIAALLVPYGRIHDARYAFAFLRELHQGLDDTASLSLVLAAAAAFRWARQRPAIGLAPLSCAAAVFASCGGLLYTAPVLYLRGPFDLAEKLVERAGPSQGRWRLFVNRGLPPPIDGLTPRFTVTASLAQALMPQFNSIAGIEGLAPYFSAADPNFNRAIQEAPEKYFDLFGVRFAVEMPYQFSETTAAARGFHKLGLGYWVRSYPARPRAWVVGRADRVESADEAVARVVEPGFAMEADAVIRGASAPAAIRGAPGPASFERISAEQMRVRAGGPGLLVVGEHFDPGWSASVDGRSAPVLETDLAALGVELPAGSANVELRFSPPWFVGGLWIALVSSVALLIAARRSRR
jgi:hypothetical protein